MFNEDIVYQLLLFNIFLTNVILYIIKTYQKDDSYLGMYMTMYCFFWRRRFILYKETNLQKMTYVNCNVSEKYITICIVNHTLYHISM